MEPEIEQEEEPETGPLTQLSDYRPSQDISRVEEAVIRNIGVAEDGLP